MWSAIKGFFRRHWRSLLIVGGIAAAIYGGVRLHIDAKILALFALIAGFVTNGFAALAALVAVIPVVGPLLIKLLSIPVLYVLNSLGYLVSLMGIKKGYHTGVISYRVLTIILLVGVVIGYIVGNLLPLN